MENRFREDRERDWRRFDEDEDFASRPGGLNRRWGYGARLTPGYRRESIPARDRSNEFQYDDEYNAPDYWIYQESWMRPGPFTGAGPRGYQRSDDRILEDVCERLSQHAQIDASDIEIEVENGEVTLKGTVRDRRMKRMAEANIELVSGVIDIHNRLHLQKQPDPEQERKKREAEEMADRFPGGPTPTGPAGY